MDNKKILESARDKLREQQPVENVAAMFLVWLRELPAQIQAVNLTF